MVEFYLLTFSRFPLRKKKHKCCFGKNRTRDFRTSRCADYLLDHSGDEGRKDIITRHNHNFILPLSPNSYPYRIMSVVPHRQRRSETLRHSRGSKIETVKLFSGGSVPCQSHSRFNRSVLPRFTPLKKGVPGTHTYQMKKNIG